MSEILRTRSAIDGCDLGSVPVGDMAAAITAAHAAFLQWRLVPAPVRGAVVRRIGELARLKKDELAAVIVRDIGKTPSEARGEVQEWIDMAEFAVGLSRQLHGLTIASERPGHRLIETWQPLGVVGVITAFNFPMAVWAWNALLALVCGDTVVWKPSEKALHSALAVHALARQALSEMQQDPAVLQLVCGPPAAGELLAADSRVALVSATGSTRMGKAVAMTVAARLGRTLLELGGNNAAIVTPTADPELALRAITFAAAGTAGQRCTTLRRLLVHRDCYDSLVPRLKSAYDSLHIGDPREPGILIGPLIDHAALTAMQTTLALARQQGGRVHGGQPLSLCGDGAYVRPALVEIAADAVVVQDEVFAPILYVSPYTDLSVAITANNAVAHGLSSAILTNDLREAERFLAPDGSDCGIANINVGTSGAEIGGAFGGEKASGGGREAGSDSWKAYMRRVTTTVNGSAALPLAQGVVFA